MEEITADIRELEQLLPQARRENVRKLLLAELERLKAQAEKLKATEKKQSEQAQKEMKNDQKSIIYEPISSYSYDQDKPDFVRFSKQRLR